MKKKNLLPELKTYSTSKTDSAWLYAFNTAMTGRHLEYVDFLTSDPDTAASVRKTIMSARNSERRDFAKRGVKVTNDVEDLPQSSSLDFEHYLCTWCLKKSCECSNIFQDGPTARYSPEDYKPKSSTVDGLIYNVRLLRKLQELSFEPYGEAPEGLQVGDRVRVCLNYHIYQGHWGVIIGERRKGEYLVEIRSRFAPKGSGSSYTPEDVHGRLYVRLEALSRVEIESVETKGA